MHLSLTLINLGINTIFALKMKGEAPGRRKGRHLQLRRSPRRPLRVEAHFSRFELESKTRWATNEKLATHFAAKKEVLAAVHAPGEHETTLVSLSYRLDLFNISAPRRDGDTDVCAACGGHTDLYVKRDGPSDVCPACDDPIDDACAECDGPTDVCEERDDSIDDVRAECDGPIDVCAECGDSSDVCDECGDPIDNVCAECDGLMYARTVVTRPMYARNMMG